MKLHSTQETTLPSAIPPTGDLVAEAEGVTERIRRYAETWRRERIQPLQDALVAARTQETMGTNGCLLSGRLWILGWLCGVLLGEMSSNLLLLVPAVCLGGGTLLLVGSGGLYLFGLMRRRTVLSSARDHGFVLRDPGTGTSTWIVRGSSRDVHASPTTTAEVIAGEGLSPAGARLEAGLAADRRHRAELAEHIQRKLGWAGVLEALGRRGCLAVGLGAVASLPFLMTGVGRPAESPLPYALGAMVTAGAIGLPICTLLVGAGNGWRWWLLRAARRQALEVERVNDSGGSTP